MIEILANWIAIITFLFLFLGTIFKGFQNLVYVKKMKIDFFKRVNEEEMLELLKEPLVLDIRGNIFQEEQAFYIKFSERIFDLEVLYVDEKTIANSDFSAIKYQKKEIDFDTSVIDIEESIIWSTEIREFYSMGKLKWETATGMIGEFTPAGAAGKEAKNAINIVYKHTFKSIAYHFFQR